MEFEKTTPSSRLKSMLNVDFKRLVLSPITYIMAGACLVIPILMLVMTQMMDGMVSVDPQTGMETVMKGFESAFQALSQTTEASKTMDMSITGMCNINMIYFIMAVFVCVFISSEFRSGYAKNLFTNRAKKTEYVVSKTIVCTLTCMAYVLIFFIGILIGGKIAGLPFDLMGASVMQAIMCLITKVALCMVFVPIFIVACVFAKQRTWLSIIMSLCIGMLFFTMIPIISPLDTNILNLIMSIVGGGGIAIGLGAVSNLILKKTNII
ncbi:MAG: ABC transporter permease [Clostridia bacterium]|nr:ABC transporter permease [Clostridia bacterium]